MLLAALGHDLDHPGLANAYYSKVWHLDSGIYKTRNISEEMCRIPVLEWHHNTKLMKLAMKHGIIN